MDNKNIAQDIMKAHYELTRQQEPLEEIARIVAKSYKKRQPSKEASSVKLDEQRENELCKIVTQASHLSNPELDEEFLTVMPDLHFSWKAIKLINQNTDLQKVYAVIMLAIYEGQIPMEAETRILCLDNVDQFVMTLNKCGHQWSRKAQTIMRTQHPKLHHRLFEQTRDYDTYMV
jgi:hypothetical protein